MDVILTKDVDKIGKAHTVVNVKEGFARNFLFPHNLAKPVTPAGLKKLELEKQAYEEKLRQDKEQLLKLKEKIDLLSLNIPALAQDDEKLYGGIGQQDIWQALKNEGIQVAKNSIDLPDPIKALGVYDIKIKLHSEITAKLKLWVVKK